MHHGCRLQARPWETSLLGVRLKVLSPPLFDTPICQICRRSLVGKRDPLQELSPRTWGLVSNGFEVNQHRRAEDLGERVGS
jgi:hypothetical protein